MNLDAGAVVAREYRCIVGQKITEVRPLTEEELKIYFWDGGNHHGTIPIAIVLSSGMRLIPSCDPEGNGAGHVFIEDM